tara:strand:+ start:1590 stop:1760 length:171 start_codon:yes stop_codon:yes gene_type:complete
MAFTILLALILSFGLRSWGIHHPEPFIASGFSLALLLGLPVVLIGISAALLGFKQI